jgi:hypothetical protein
VDHRKQARDLLCQNVGLGHRAMRFAHATVLERHHPWFCPWLTDKTLDLPWEQEIGRRFTQIFADYVPLKSENQKISGYQRQSAS